MRNAVLALHLLLAFAVTACVDGEAWETEDDDDAVELAETSSAAYVTGPMVAFEPAESYEELVNPERGYYVSYDLLDADDNDATSIRADGFSLAIAIVNLEDYRTRSLDWELMQALKSGFAKARAAGIKLIVRFTYNDSADAGDASKSRVLGHISQLKTVLRDNADVIAVLQAGFIGAWGEWHGSTNGLDNASARAEILAALLGAMPSTRSVQVRTPMYKNEYRPGPVAPAEAYTGSSRSRLGHHNDCFLASSSDLGTYASPVSTWTSYMTQDSLYVPVGGETCKLNAPRTDCSSALAEMEKMHWSYLNSEYKGSVLAEWADQGCDDDVAQRLGYHFVLRRVAHTERVAPGGVLALEVDIRNRGFAVPFNARPIDVVLTKGSTRHVARLSFDARRLPAGLKTRITAHLRVPANLAPGTYTLALRLPDASSSLAADPRYAIRLANSGTWSSSTGDNLLTTSFKIDAAAPGEKDPTATTFKQLP